jgi:hypothetical protein
MTDFVEENDSEICEPVCRSKLIAFLINCHEFSINCPHKPVAYRSIRDTHPGILFVIVLTLDFYI